MLDKIDTNRDILSLKEEKGENLCFILLLKLLTINILKPLIPLRLCSCQTSGRYNLIRVYSIAVQHA